MSGSESLFLLARPDAVGLSRGLATAALRRWGLERLTDDAQMVVSELVSNAIKAAPGWAIKVTVSRGQECVLLEVQDRAPGRPELNDAPPGAESGRGLRIVDALAARWGCYPTRTAKIVWAQVGDGLPQRARQQVTPYAPAVRADPAVLHRVHDKLKALLP